MTSVIKKCVFIIECYCMYLTKLELTLFSNHVTSCD